MKFPKTVLIAHFLFSFIFCNAQQKNKSLKITYSAYPVSTLLMPPSTSSYFKAFGSIITLGQSYKYKYSLFINPEKSQSIYKLDSLIREKIPVGKEKDIYTVNNNLDYVVKTDVNNYFKHEKLYKTDFYTKANRKEIEWEITNDSKVISNMQCHKAISKNKDYMITVWFTDEIPVSSGPSTFFGLPGLVVWSEDFHWTTEIEKIEYIDNYDFESQITNYNKLFETNKKNNYMDEGLFLHKKAEDAMSIIDDLKK